MEWLILYYEGGIKSDATNDAMWQFKVGLHFCLLQTFKVLSCYRYTKFKSFNPILEGFLIVFFGYTSKEVKFGSTYVSFGKKYIFYQHDFSLDEGREKKSQGGGGSYIRRTGWIF